MPHSDTPLRRCLIPLLALGLVLGACGGDAPTRTGNAPKGSADNPLVGKLEEGPSASKNEAGQATPAPAYDKLVEQQTAKPRSDFTPCNLVTRKEAQAILGRGVKAPVEAAQGPTCIYRTEDGDSFVTISVQSLDLNRAKRRLREPRRVDVSGRRAYCGVLGQPTLFAGVSGGQVLTVSGRCKVARRFAAQAVQRLED
jgi:Protein of unknown function (DUF3558)